MRSFKVGQEVTLANGKRVKIKEIKMNAGLTDCQTGIIYESNSGNNVYVAINHRKGRTGKVRHRK